MANFSHVVDDPEDRIIFPLPHPPQGAFESYALSQYWIQSRSHMSAFGGRREVDKQGVPHRHHAAVDLYSPEGTIVMAIADGVVIDDMRGYLQWKDATPGKDDPHVYLSALAIKHPGLGIVRYCEISTRRAIGVGWQFPVKRGQAIGLVGDQGAEMVRGQLVRRQTMLHLEWYRDLDDDQVDPNHGADAFGEHVLSQGVRTRKGKNGKPDTVYPANTTYDSFENLKFDRRHDLVDPTEMIRTADVLTMATPPGFCFDDKPRAQAPPSLIETLRKAKVVPYPTGGSHGFAETTR